MRGAGEGCQSREGATAQVHIEICVVVADWMAGICWSALCFRESCAWGVNLRDPATVGHYRAARSAGGRTSAAAGMLRATTRARGSAADCPPSG